MKLGLDQCRELTMEAWQDLEHSFRRWWEGVRNERTVASSRGAKLQVIFFLKSWLCYTVGITEGGEHQSRAPSLSQVLCARVWCSQDVVLSWNLGCKTPPAQSWPLAVRSPLHQRALAQHSMFLNLLCEGGKNLVLWLPAQRTFGNKLGLPPWGSGPHTSAVVVAALCLHTGSLPIAPLSYLVLRRCWVWDWTWGRLGR